MRNHFADELTNLAGEIDNLITLSGDIGNRLFNNYKDKFPERFFNCGVAEANMVSMAAGLALSDMRPVVYTIAPFITSRCYEQIRLDVCYHNVPVVIVAVGAGLSYASIGPTHHACEDIGILRILPNMSVICPGDPMEVRWALRAALNYDGPVYIRLGKKNEPIIYQDDPNFEIGKAIILREGTDVCLLSTGNMLDTTMAVADELAESGVSSQVVSFHTVKPLDIALLEEVFAAFQLVVTIEEHSRLGGFGGSVAEWLTDQVPQNARLCRIGTSDTFMPITGHQEYARSYFMIDQASITKTIHQQLG